MAKRGHSGEGTKEQHGASLAAPSVLARQRSARSKLSDVPPSKWQITCDLPNILSVLEEEAELVLLHLQEELVALLTECDSKATTRTGEM